MKRLRASSDLIRLVTKMQYFFWSLYVNQGRD